MPIKRALPKQAASFIETMDCLPVSKLPDGPYGLMKSNSEVMRRAYLLQLNITVEGGQVSFKDLRNEKQRSSYLPSSNPSPERIDESS
jgi:hypothetical protein